MLCLQKPNYYKRSSNIIVGQNGDEKEICTECEKQMDTIMESDDPSEIKSAINYIYTCSLSASDDEVAKFLKQTIETNSSAVEEQETKQTKSKPVDINQKRDYFAEEKEGAINADGNIWISGLKVFAWISFVAIIISGIASFITIGGWTGFLALLGSIILGWNGHRHTRRNNRPRIHSSTH